jgi:hypothetical protein
MLTYWLRPTRGRYIASDTSPVAPLPAPELASGRRVASPLKTGTDAVSPDGLATSVLDQGTLRTHSTTGRMLQGARLRILTGRHPDGTDRP